MIYYKPNYIYHLKENETMWWSLEPTINKHLQLLPIAFVMSNHSIYHLKYCEKLMSKTLNKKWYGDS